MIIGDQNIDLVHSIVEENPNNLELVINDTTSKIVFNIPHEVLMQEWTKFRFELDFKNEKIRCQVNDIMLEDDLPGFDEKKGIILVFGDHDVGSFSSTDLPPMILRDVEVLSDDKDKYKWPLNETEGNIAHSDPRGNNGVASNPIWMGLLKRHNTWENILNINLTGGVKVAFDPDDDDLYLLSKDSVHIFDLGNKAMRSIAHNNPSFVETTNSLIFNPNGSGLTIYSLDNNFISTFNPETGLWSAYDAGNEVETEYWHHNHIISPDGSIITFGGYGHFKYNNSVFKWNPEVNRFDSL